MMSGSIVDVEPSLISRNTLGNRNHNSKSQIKLGYVGGRLWWENYAEVMVEA